MTNKTIGSAQIPDIITSCLKVADRREHLGKMMNLHKISCPKCNTRQVQLIGYMDITPAQWRYRHCKHKFEWEK